MLEKNGDNGNDEQHWTLTVPDEHCTPGLEVTIVVQSDGIFIGDGKIPWEDIDKARSAANAYKQT